MNFNSFKKILMLSSENTKLQEKIRLLEEENEFLKNQIDEQINKDHLTGLYNRNLAHKAHDESQTVIMCDIDDFKKFNDIYGHNTGDEILKEIAFILKTIIKEDDYVIRWGGEEFIIFIKDDINEAVELAEKVRNAVKSLEGRVMDDGTVLPTVTMSFGISSLTNDNSFKQNVEIADKSLYESKHKGKDTVTVAESDTKDVKVLKKTI